MPEGDTLRRAAAKVAPILVGCEVTDIWFRKLRGHRPRSGQTIESVEAVGKHLLIHFDRQITLRTHLGMAGSWRVAAPTAAAPRNPRLRTLIRTGKGTALCFSAPTIETYLRDGKLTPIDHLGPDLSNDSVDLDAVISRSRTFGSRQLVAETLLDQRVAAGVGNVFKSEVAFLAGVHPHTATAALSDDSLATLWQTAHHQLVANRSRSGRKTTSATIAGRYYVYERSRQGCRRCSGSILYSAAGALTERSTYWCPRCQGSPLRST